MQQNKSEMKRMIEKARVGGYLSTLAYYVYMEVPPSLRIEGVKGGPYHRPKGKVPVVPLLGSFDPVKSPYNNQLLREQEEWADVLVLLATWQWQNSGIIFHKALTALSILEDTKTDYYNVHTDLCDYVCCHCGQVNKKFLFIYPYTEGYICPLCTP